MYGIDEAFCMPLLLSEYCITEYEGLRYIQHEPKTLSEWHCMAKGEIEWVRERERIQLKNFIINWTPLNGYQFNCIIWELTTAQKPHFEAIKTHFVHRHRYPFSLRQMGLNILLCSTLNRIYSMFGVRRSIFQIHVQCSVCGTYVVVLVPAIFFLVSQLIFEQLGFVYWQQLIHCELIVRFFFIAIFHFGS